MSETKTYRALRALYYGELGVIDRDTQVELTDAQYVVNAKSLVAVKQPPPEKNTEGGDGDPQPNNDAMPPGAEKGDNDPPSGSDPVPDGDPSHDDDKKGDQNETTNDGSETGDGDNRTAGKKGTAGKRRRGGNGNRKRK